MSNHQKLTPLERLFSLIRDDKSDLLTLVGYNIISGVLYLAVPLSAQALINTIAAGVLIQPLVVLSIIVFVVLILISLLKLIQNTIIERLQQRIFARIALRLASHLPRIEHSILQQNYAPEMANRFFDTMSVQKAWAKLLTDVPAAILQILAGLFLMGIYSPFLFGFDMMFLFGALIITWLGIHGVDTSIKESSQKYRVAGSLEELGRCHISLKMNASPDYFVRQLDHQVLDYIESRREHFSIVVKQVFSSHLLQAIAMTGVLASGGWLVIEGQLTLGQLVAAELVMMIMLAAIEKLANNIDDYYDLLTALVKVGSITDQPIEKIQGTEYQSNEKGAKILCQQLSFAYLPNQPVLTNLNLEIQSGQRVSLVGESGCGKTTLAYLLAGLQKPSAGRISFNGFDIREVNLDSLRRQIALVSGMNEIFEGTVEDNILMGRKISHDSLRQAISLANLDNTLVSFPEGLKTRLVSEGLNISIGERLRILIARAIVKQPKLLILDDVFFGIDEKNKLKILEKLLAPDLPWTVIDISHDPSVIMRSDIVHVLYQGHIAESGKPTVLLSKEDGLFKDLFPELANRYQKTVQS